MAGDRELQEKVSQVPGEGLTRRIHLAAISALVLFGIALQGAVWWYSFQAASREWGTEGILVCAFAAGVWPLAVGLLHAPMWKRLKGTLKEPR